MNFVKKVMFCQFSNFLKKKKIKKYFLVILIVVLEGWLEFFVVKLGEKEIYQKLKDLKKI